MLKVERDYRVHADVLIHDSWLPVGGPALVQAGRPGALEVPWLDTTVRPSGEKIRFRFWPPAPSDDVDHWTCPCDRPAFDGVEAGPGHWERRAELVYDEPPLLA